MLFVIYYETTYRNLFVISPSHPDPSISLNDGSFLNRHRIDQISRIEVSKFLANAFACGQILLILLSCDYLDISFWRFPEFLDKKFTRHVRCILFILAVSRKYGHPF